MTTWNPMRSPEDTLERLQSAGWAPGRQVVSPCTYTAGRILRQAQFARHETPRKAEVLLRLTRDLPLSVVESASSVRPQRAALRQAIDHATWMGLPFAHALGPNSVLEHELRSGQQREIKHLPGPADLWSRARELGGITDAVAQCLLAPSHHDVHRPLHYHHIRAIHAAIEAVARGEKHVRLVLGAGTGRTFVAFQICRRLWAAHWNVKSEPRRPRILYVCEGDDLLDQARTGVFASFREARHTLADGAVKNREIYFATPEMLLQGTPVQRAFEAEFFDLIIEDRSAPEPAVDDPALDQVLRYFQGAVRLRLSPSPAAAGPAHFTYSLREGVEDGVLAPFQLVEIDRGSDEPLTRPEGTQSVAAALAGYLEATDPFAKTLVFCGDDEHAARMTALLSELCSARIAEHRNYLVCITPELSGRVQLDRFRDVDRRTPVVGIATRTTSMRSVPTLANVALCAPLESDSELIWEVGQGAYLRTGHGKWHYDVLDFTGRARDGLARTKFVAEPDSVSSWNPTKGGVS